MQDQHGGRGKDDRVVLVGEEALPVGNDWAVIDLGGELWLAVKRDHWSPELMAEAWAEYAAAC